MPERIDWLEDGTASGAPYSPRFGDRYRGELGGIDQARNVFLAGCGLPGAWAGQAQWRILETGFGLGLNFLVTWQAWKADSGRPRMLHFMSTEAFPASAEDVLRAAAAHPELLPLATLLHGQLWGLLPGFHRLVFEGGQVLLTLCVGDAKLMLREQQFEADSVYLDGFSPHKNPGIWDVHTMKAVARCSRRGTRIATWTIARSVRDALAEAGFLVEKTPGMAPKRDNLQGQYNPPWIPKKRTADIAAPRSPGHCVVIGAGLAGAAVAASLVRRGWAVTVMDAADVAASGASSLPAGLLAPHVSPDDGVLSRLSRSGVRLTLQQANMLLAQGVDWAHSGVLERDLGDMPRKLPASWTKDQTEAAAAWSLPASAAQLAQAGLPGTARGLWHAQAAWIKPGALVRTWLETAGVACQGNASAVRLEADAAGWQVLDKEGKPLAHAELVVVAAGYASRALAEALTGRPLPLQPIRGQVSFGLHDAQTDGKSSTPGFPVTPVNGHGSLIPAVPMAGGSAWVSGSSYERDSAMPEVKPNDHRDNLERLRILLPLAAAEVEKAFGSQEARGWAGIRCATPNRLPMLGPVAATTSGAEVWICTGMGSRGLTFAALCAELLAAKLHGEPLPLEQSLARAMALRQPPDSLLPRGRP
jgi:tRNA 5-methylaminomethyl-2-thiouridine biosynthesis bifunctional protein